MICLPQEQTQQYSQTSIEVHRDSFNYASRVNCLTEMATTPAPAPRELLETVQYGPTKQSRNSGHGIALVYVLPPYSAFFISAKANCVVALLLYSRSPISSLWSRSGGVLPVRESAHGAEARRRGHERHWEAKGWRTLRAHRHGG